MRHRWQLVRSAARNDEGLTLIELIVSMVILGLIAGVCALALTTSIKTSIAASDRIKQSNDEQLITTFLQKDAASAGGYEPSNAPLLPGFQPGVARNLAFTTGDWCHAPSSRVRFEWVEGAASATPVRTAVNYTLDTARRELTRTACTQNLSGAPNDTTTSAVLGHQVSDAVLSCVPACAVNGPISPLPIQVTLTVTEASNVATGPLFSFSVTAFVRAGGNALQSNPEVVPLIALGIPNDTPLAQCPQPRTLANSFATSGFSAVGSTNTFLLVYGIAAINSTANTTTNPGNCGRAGYIPTAAGMNATETLVVSPGECTNCTRQINIAEPIPDPYRPLTANPPPNADRCGPTAGPWDAPAPSGNPNTDELFTYYPGVYRSAVDLGNLPNRNPATYQFDFMPGIYIFCAGLRVSSGTLVTGDPLGNNGGVLFYFAHGSLSRNLNYRNNRSSICSDQNGQPSGKCSDMQFIVTGRPEYGNIFLWQPNTTVAGGDVQISMGDDNGDASPPASNYKGVIYAPYAQVEFYVPDRADLTSIEANATGVVARNIVLNDKARLRAGPGPQTTTDLVVAPNPATVGETVTFTATVAAVAPATGTPSGTVDLFDETQNLGTAPLVNGIATFSTTELIGGSRPLRAVYSGDGTFASSVSPTVNQVQTQAPSAVSVISTPNPSGFNQPMSLRATVTGPGPVPTGAVEFYDGTTLLGTVPLVGGIGTMPIPQGPTTFALGDHTVTARYLGDVSYLPADSAPYTHRVLQPSGVNLLPSSANPAYPGQSVTITAVVTPGATGTLTFFDNGVAIPGSTTTLTGANNTVAFPLPPLSLGTHPITATYSGDATFAGSTSNTLSQTIAKIATTTVLGTSNGNVTGGTSVTFTATVTATNPPSGAPPLTGTVTFMDGVTPIGSPIALNGSPTVTRSTSTLRGGIHSITAVYNGSAVYNTSTSPAVNQTVGLTVILTRVSGEQFAGRGDSITYRADVSGPLGNATGSISFRSNPVSISQTNVGLVGGAAQRTTSFANTGTYTITAVYTPGVGSPYPSMTSNDLIQNVGSDTTITLTRTVGGSPANLGSSLTFRANVGSPNNGGSNACRNLSSGTVTFTDGNGVVLGAGPINLNNGNADLVINSLPLGNSTINAHYDGSANCASSTTNLGQQIEAGTTIALIRNSSASIVFGEQSSYTATIGVVSPATGPATGTVTFRDNGSTVATVNVVNGSATWTSATLNAAAHPITATFNGSGAFADAGPSASITQTVTRANTTTTLQRTGGQPSQGYGQTLEFTATVATVAPGTGTPTGTVTFTSSISGALGTVTLTNGRAVLTTNSLAAATAPAHSITATYNPPAQPNYNASTSSSPVAQTVTVANTSVVVTTNPNPGSYGNSLTLTATVSFPVGSAITGNVIFRDGSAVNAPIIGNAGGYPVNSSGVASTTASFTLLGGHVIRADYQGNANLNPSNGSVALNINKANTTVVAGSGAATYGTPVTLTAVVSFPAGGVITGNVIFRDGAAANAPIIGNIGGYPVDAAGLATTTTTFTTVGNRTIRADYLGDANLNASNDTVGVNVGKAATTVTITSSVNPAGLNQTITYTANVTPSVPGTPTGTVVFLSDGNPIGGAQQNRTVSGGVASVQTSFSTNTPTNSRSITAVYSGDLNFNGSTSSALTQNFTPPPNITGITNLGRNSTSNLTISGSGFTNGGQFLVTVVQPGNCAGTVNLLSTTFNNASSITIRVSASGASTSNNCRPVVTVRNADGQTNTGTITIQ